MVLLKQNNFFMHTVNPNPQNTYYSDVYWGRQISLTKIGKKYLKIKR